MSFKELVYWNDLGFDSVVQAQATNPVFILEVQRLPVSSFQLLDLSQPSTFCAFRRCHLCIPTSPYFLDQVQAFQ